MSWYIIIIISKSITSRSAFALVLLALQYSHIAQEVTHILINNIYICHLASQIGQFVQNNWFTSASAFLHSHRILLCACVVALSEKASTIQYGYRKLGTYARVFAKTLAHGNSKNEIRQRKRGRYVSMERRKAGTKNEVPRA